MTEYGQWYRRIKRDVETLEQSLSEKERSKYRLERLLKVAARVEEFSPSCGECQLKQQEIEQMAQQVTRIAQLPDRQKLKNYRKKLDEITKHLQKAHKLVPPDYYRGIGMGLGIAVASGIGLVLENLAIGTGLGLVLGLAIGSYLDKKAEKEGRVI